MRKRQIYYGILLVLLLIIDFIIQSVFSLRMFRWIGFVSQLHFLGLLLMTDVDSRLEITLKVIVVAFVMDLFHYGSFPIYYISYGLSAMVVRIWYRHIGKTFVETTVLMAVGLFLKEVFLYASLYVFKGMHYPFTEFLATRSIWIIIGNLVLFPIAYSLFNYVERKIDSESNNYFY